MQIPHIAPHKLSLNSLDFISRVWWNAIEISRGWCSWFSHCNPLAGRAQLDAIGSEYLREFPLVHFCRPFQWLPADLNLCVRLKAPAIGVPGDYRHVAIIQCLHSHAAINATPKRLSTTRSANRSCSWLYLPGYNFREWCFNVKTQINCKHEHIVRLEMYANDCTECHSILQSLTVSSLYGVCRNTASFDVTVVSQVIFPIRW